MLQSTPRDTDQLSELGRSVQEGSKLRCVVADASDCICLQLGIKLNPCSCSTLHRLAKGLSPAPCLGLGALPALQQCYADVQSLHDQSLTCSWQNACMILANCCSVKQEGAGTLLSLDTLESWYKSAGLGTTCTESRITAHVHHSSFSALADNHGVVGDSMHMIGFFWRCLKVYISAAPSFTEDVWLASRFASQLPRAV